MIKQAMTLAAVCVAALTLSTAHADVVHEHEGDVIVGVTDAGQLAVEAPFELDGGEEHIHVLMYAAAEGSLYTGFTADEPGFDHLHTDEPDEDFYALGEGASILFRVLAIDAGLVVRRASDGLILADSVGDTGLIGGSELHTHLVFHAAGASAGDEFHLEIELIDQGSTAYADSDPFEFHLEAVSVPEPASFALLALGGLVTLVRRRRR